jgi:flagellar protein FliJ
MRRFIFPLQQVLNLRIWEEREKEIALGRVVSERVQLEKQIEDRRRREQEVFLHRPEGFDMQLLSGIEQFGLRMRSERKELSRRLEETRREEEEARKLFLEVSRKRKVLDKLKERKEESYRKLALKDEQKALDELGGNRFFLEEEVSPV